MALPNYPRNPDYGTGTYRRRIRLEQGDGCVYGALEDTNHGFTVTVYHDGEATPNACPTPAVLVP